MEVRFGEGHTRLHLMTNAVNTQRIAAAAPTGMLQPLDVLPDRVCVA